LLWYDACLISVIQFHKKLTGNFEISGKLLQSLAVATSKGSFLSVDQIIYNGIGFTIAAVSTAAITTYAKKALQKLQAEDELC
jgi:hypothetical protein